MILHVIMLLRRVTCCWKKKTCFTGILCTVLYMDVCVCVCVGGVLTPIHKNLYAELYNGMRACSGESLHL